jgi:diguanylate cyclase (GGDEF)-like protein
MFLKALESYYVPGVALLIFSAFLLTDQIFSRRSKRLFLLETGVLLLLIVETWADGVLSSEALGGIAWKLRTATTFIEFSLSPCPLIILVLIYQADSLKGAQRLFYLPQLCNLILCVSSVFTGSIFYISPDNYYSRGPLFFLPFTITAFYMFLLLYFAGKQKNKPSRRIESIFILSVMAVVALASVLEIFAEMWFLIWGTAGICTILYFLLLMTQKILYDPVTGSLSRVAYEKQLEKISGNMVGTVAMIDLNNLKQINDQEGHSAGDVAICGVSAAIFKTKTKHMRLYRYGGDEFVLLSNRLCGNEMLRILTDAQKCCAASQNPSYSFAYGVAEYYSSEEMSQAIESADAEMYRCKQRMKA